MGHTPHELAQEFPEHVETLHALKARDPHFARIAEEYHEVNREIHRLESRIEAGSEDREEELRRKRVHLKDEIAAALSKAASGG